MPLSQTLASQVGIKIEDALSKKNMKKRRFAQIIGVSPGRVNQWTRKESPVLARIDYWAPIENVLEERVFDVVREATVGYKKDSY